MIKPTLRLGTWAAIGVIVLVGTINGLGYLLTPLLAQHPERVAAYLRETTGLELEIGALRAHWSGRGPVLELQRVRTGTGGGGSLQLDSARVDLHLPGLLSGDPLRITLSGLKLRLERTADGRVRLVGAGPLDTAGDEAPLTFETLPAHLRLQAAEIHWRDRRTGAPPLTLAPVDLILHSDSERTRLAARVDTAGGTLRAAAELRELLTGAGADGRAAFEIDDLDLARLSSGYLPLHYSLRSFVLSGRGQIRIRDGAVTAADGRVEVRDLRLAGRTMSRVTAARTADSEKPEDPARGLDIPWMSSEFQWRHDDQWRRLRLHQLQLLHKGRRWPSSELVVAWRGEAHEVAELRAAADFVRIEDLLSVLQIRPPRPELFLSLYALAPRGDLHGLQLHLTRHDGDLDWHLATDFRDLGVDAGPESPGITALHGRLNATPNRIGVRLGAEASSLHAPRLFPEAVPIRRLQGVLDWRRAENGGWQLTSDRLRIDLPDLSTQSRLRLEEGADAGGLFIDLQTAFSAEDLSQAGRYYPIRVMRPSLVRWLDRGLVSGRIPAGTLLLHGPLADFPFDPTHTGHFEVLFGAEDLIIDYQREWPRLEEITAELRFHNNRMDALIESAKIYRSTVEDTRVSLPSLEPALPVEIRGQVRGPLADELRLLRESPLRRRFAEIAGALRAEGSAHLRLDTAVPVDVHGEYRLSGSLEFDDAALTIVDRDLTIDRLQGPLLFDLDSVRAEEIRGRALGAPIALEVRRERPRWTDIVSRGRFDVAALRRQLPWLDRRLAAGASDYRVELALPDDRDAAPVLRVHSDLVGTELRLPAPLGKAAEPPRALTVEVPLGGTAGDDVIRARLGDDAHALLSSDLRRVRLQLGAAPDGLDEQRGLRIGGRLAELRLQPWLDWLQMSDSDSDAASAPPPGGDRLPVGVALRVDRVDLDGFQLQDVDLDLRRRNEAWSGRVVSPRLSGHFNAPPAAARTPVELDLDHLRLDYSPEDGADRNTPTQHDRLDPTALPPVDLVCRRLVVNGQDLGTLQATVRRVPRGLKFAQVRLSDGALRMDATGEWLQEPESTVTRFQGLTATDDLGALLTTLGFGQQIEDAPAEARFVFQWPGDPAQFGLSAVVGNLELDIGQGKFTDIDPGVTRMIGLLNFNALRRRLRLDFSDLFGEGFAFDSITGSFELNYGDAVTDDLTLKGPAGLIEVRGRTGLKAQDFDQRVSVTPRFDATLPVASTIAGGPVAGVVVLLAQQVMRDEVDKINRFQYRVSGGWRDPEIELLDSGGTLSKLFGSITGRGQGEADSDDSDAAEDEPAEPPESGFSDAPQ